MNAKIENIQVQGDTLTILTGQAPDPINLKPVKVSGAFTGLAEFMKTRILEPSETRVEYSVENGWAKVITNEGLPNEYTVDGKIEPTQAFLSLIRKHSNPSELAELLRRNRKYFADSEAGSKLIIALKNFKAKVDKEVEKVDDRKGGHFKSAVDKVVKTDLPESITLKMPIVKGDPEPAVFLVDIYVDVRDNGIDIELESIEALEIFDYTRRTEIESFLEAFVQDTFFSIEVN